MTCNAEPQGLHYVGTCIRPPSEAFSILLQATLGCSHNRCTFCGTYKDKRFTIKDRAIWEQDLQFASKYCKHQNRVFIMDGDALIMPMKHWEWLLSQIRDRMPWVERVSTYGNSKGVAKKSDEDLLKLSQMGLKMVYYGVESGDDEVLNNIVKGGDQLKLIEQGKRLKKAGMKISVTVLLGIGGQERSPEHAKETGKLLTAMDPDYVGALTLMLLPGTPLYKKHQQGQFQLPDAQGMLTELREMIYHTNLTNGRFHANHASNYLPIKALFPQDKEKTLALLDSSLEGKVALRPEWLRAL